MKTYDGLPFLIILFFQIGEIIICRLFNFPQQNGIQFYSAAISLYLELVSVWFWLEKNLFKKEPKKLIKMAWSNLFNRFVLRFVVNFPEIIGIYVFHCICQFSHWIIVVLHTLIVQFQRFIYGILKHGQIHVKIFKINGWNFVPVTEFLRIELKTGEEIIFNQFEVKMLI